MKIVNRVIQEFLKEKTRKADSIDAKSEMYIQNITQGVEYVFEWLADPSNLFFYLIQNHKMPLKECVMCLTCLMNNPDMESSLKEILKNYNEDSFKFALDLLTDGVDIDKIKYLQTIEDRGRLLIAHNLFSNNCSIDEFEEFTKGVEEIHVVNLDEANNISHDDYISMGIVVYCDIVKKSHSTLEEEAFMKSFELRVLMKLSYDEVSLLIDDFGAIPYLVKRCYELKQMN